MAALALLAGAAVAPAAHAQATGDSSVQPFRGLFGGASQQPAGPNSLLVAGSLFAGYDDDIFARGGGTRPNGPRVSGEYAGVQASLAYARQLRTSSFFLRGSTSARYLPDSRQLVPTFHAGAVGFSSAVSNRTSYSVFQSAVYRPFFFPTLVPAPSTLGSSIDGGSDVVSIEGDVSQTPEDVTLGSANDAYLYQSGAQLTRRFSARGNLGLRVGYGVTDFRASDQGSADNRRINAGGLYTYALTSYLSARLGYTYRSFGVSTGRDTVAHDLDVGLQLNRALRFQRGRTEFSATTGSTIVIRDRLSVDSRADRATFRLVGNASLTHSFRAPWQAQVRYSRTVGFVDGLSEPVQGDRILASFGGFITPSVDASVSAGYFSGSAGLGSERDISTATAGARLRFAVSSNMALFAQYFFFSYSLSDAVATALLSNQDIERQGLRAGLTVWFPLVR